jgi:ABC-2 type transport system ATP-binding protein
MNALDFEGVCRAYRAGADVLNDVTFSVESGQVVGLVGKNGAGKTTLIRIAMGMIEAQRGHVTVLGLNPRRDGLDLKRRIGYVAEEQLLPPYMKVGEILDLHERLFPTWDAAMAASLLDRFELSRGPKIRRLSKGQARRVALLCAVAHRPELLLLDEPASGLDPAARREFLETSIQLLNESGCTILFSSHYLTDVERMADRIVMLHDGGVLIDRNLDELREGFSLALVPRAAGLTRERLLAVEGCVGVRDRSDAFHAVLRLEPEAARLAVQQQLGIENVRCQTIVLEDMFIELAGGQN